MQTKLSVICVAALMLGCGLSCKSARVTSDIALAPPAATGPAVVYIADFELGAQAITRDEGLLSGRPGPLGRVGGRVSGASSDPAARARQVIDLMANTLLKELGKAGVPAARLRPDQPLASQGWLVRGVFTEVAEGNRLRRAMIGFGEGQTAVQVVATIDDLSQGKPKPLYEIATEADSGSKPGAAPTLVLSP